jgi:UDP-N-acetylglucosamine 1-carboxyvinyltransferase
MEKLVIEGGHRLEGEVITSGSKNAALPILAACLLTDEPMILHRVPRVRDIRTMEKLMSHVGAMLTKAPTGPHRIEAARVTEPTAPYELVKTMRASSLVLGPLVARCGRARVSVPGGCAIGARPINLHVSGLEKLGAVTRHEHGYIEAEAPHGLQGTPVCFDRITVTGTEDILMAAVLAQGETVIENAAREPEVVDLADLLTKMGARIEGAGTSTIRVQGVPRLHGTEHTIIPDRIEAGTYVLAGAISGGDVLVNHCEPEHLRALLSKLREAGCDITEIGNSAVRVRRTGKLRGIDIITEEHPGFPTDLQAQYMAVMTQAEGITFITENIFENRFMQAAELIRMGAQIRIDGRQAIVAGPAQLTGAQVIASDLRASASLVLAGLIAKGETVVDRMYHIDRGYENIEGKLTRIGAKIRRIDDAHERTS